MKLPNFQVIKTDDNRFKLVSDQGHSHYKEAIEMLLQSEMFIKHNAHLLYIYCVGLSMVDNGITGKVDSSCNLYRDASMQDWANHFVAYASKTWVSIGDLVDNYGTTKEINAIKSVYFTATIQLVKKVFPEITQTN